MNTMETKLYQLNKKIFNIKWRGNNLILIVF